MQLSASVIMELMLCKSRGNAVFMLVWNSVIIIWGIKQTKKTKPYCSSCSKATKSSRCFKYLLILASYYAAILLQHLDARSHATVETAVSLHSSSTKLLITLIEGQTVQSKVMLPLPLCLPLRLCLRLHPCPIPSGRSGHKHPLTT